MLEATRGKQVDSRYAKSRTKRLAVAVSRAKTECHMSNRPCGVVVGVENKAMIKSGQ